MSISLFSFFSGIGILDLAFERNRYNIVLVNEYSTQFIEAYKYARQQLGIAPPVYGYYEKSAEYFARKRGKKRLNELMQAERGRGNLVGFIGGPPCPDFSVAGKNRGSEGEHGKLTKTYFDIICRCKPDFFVFENVKGLVRTQKHSYDVFEEEILSETVEQVKENLAKKLRDSNIQVICTTHDQTWFVPRGVLLHVFYNLFTNSVYWIDKRKRWAVSDPHYRNKNSFAEFIKVESAGTEAFVVSDSGTGVIRAMEDVLFEALQSGKNYSERRGMGLYFGM